MNETNEKTPLTPEQVAAKNREVAMYYKMSVRCPEICIAARTVPCSCWSCPAPSESRYPPGSPMRQKELLII